MLGHHWSFNGSLLEQTKPQGKHRVWGVSIGELSSSNLIWQGKTGLVSQKVFPYFPLRNVISTPWFSLMSQESPHWGEEFSKLRQPEGLALWKLLQLPPKGLWALPYTAAQFAAGLLSRAVPMVASQPVQSLLSETTTPYTEIVPGIAGSLELEPEIVDSDGFSEFCCMIYMIVAFHLYKTWYMLLLLVNVLNIYCMVFLTIISLPRSWEVYANTPSNQMWFAGKSPIHRWFSSILRGLSSHGWQHGRVNPINIHQQLWITIKNN